VSARPAIAAARLVRERLEGEGDPLLAARWLRDERRPVALSGAWAGGGVLLTSEPARSAEPGDDPFALLEQLPGVEPPTGGLAVGGGWLGWLGFGLGRTLEPVPSQPPRPLPLPPFDLAFHDHVVRCDAEGRWWFEALWTEARAEALAERMALWRARIAGTPPPAREVAAGPLRVRAPGAAGHARAVAEAIDRIAAGEIYQANLCLRLEGAIEGELLDLWVRAVTESRPAYAAYVGAERHAVASLSPELFLRARGRELVSEPIKGTAPLTSDPGELARSAKDRAENVMIVDLVRNDLGRVCEYGSVTAPELFEVRPASGVWHLVSTVRGRLREDAGAADVVRACFPPGSVTGAPKVRALRVISELEATGREAYCGAIGLCSPLSGLELNVAIRTFEFAGGRMWLGAGGGVVSDSSPAAEVAEALAKARGVAVAAGVQVDGGDGDGAPAALTAPVVTLPRPDPALGLLETILVRGGVPAAIDAHLRRLRAGCAELALELPDDLRDRAAGAARELGDGRLRIRAGVEGCEVSTGALPRRGPVELRPVVLPGGLGAHKWADRRLIGALSDEVTVPLFCDLDGHVLEAGHAGVLIVEGETVTAPPLDGRLLPSLSREAALEAARASGLCVVLEPVTLDRARGADALVLSSALRGPHAGVLPGGPPARAGEEICRRLADRQR
jgi:para-aminobenzoate synthetase/4-amino-4-deoxychorismate lyase